jgi:hypothetical protein
MSTTATEMPRGAQLVRYLYASGPPWARRLPQPGETLILHGDPGSGIDEALAWIAEADYSYGPIVTIDPRFVANYAMLVYQTVIAIATDAYAGEEQDALLALRDSRSAPLPELAATQAEFLKLAASLVSAKEGYERGALATVVRNLPQGLIVVPDAHLLTERWSREALWELRGVVQEHQRHALVLGTLTEARGSLEGPDAPFLGAGSAIEVGTDRGPERWERVVLEHGLAVDKEDLYFALSRTHGLAVPTLSVLLGTDSGAHGVRASLAERVRRAAEQLPTTLQLARVITRYGPSMLHRLARGAPPYAAEAATSRDVSRALRHLAYNGLVARVDTRGWRVANPFVSDALLTTPRPPV